MNWKPLSILAIIKIGIDFFLFITLMPLGLLFIPVTIRINIKNLLIYYKKDIVSTFYVS